MTDPAEIRAEGRRLLAAAGRGGHSELTDLEVFMVDNAVVLLADPAPVGLTEETLEAARDALDALAADEREPQRYRERFEEAGCEVRSAIDRLSAPPVDDREREALRRIADGLCTTTGTPVTYRYVAKAEG